MSFHKGNDYNVGHSDNMKLSFNYGGSARKLETIIKSFWRETLKLVPAAKKGEGGWTETASMGLNKNNLYTTKNLIEKENLKFKTAEKKELTAKNLLLNQ